MKRTTWIILALAFLALAFASCASSKKTWKGGPCYLNQNYVGYN